MDFPIKKRSPTKEKEPKNKKSFLKKTKKKDIMEVKQISQKRMDIYFWSGLIGIVGLCVATVFLAFTREMRPVAVEQPEVVEVDKKEVDYRLQEFLGQYIEAYFSVSEKSEEQMLQREYLETFYNFAPDVVSFKSGDQPMNFVSYRPIEIKDGMASYRVTYEIGKEDKKKVTVLFGIPYGGDEGTYYVSGLPNFKPIEDYRTEMVDEKEQLRLGAEDKLESEEKEELNSFVELFFTNYTSSQENLDVLSSGLKSINGVTFKSLDYSYYKVGEKNIKAYVQVAFDILGHEHAENFTLTMEKREKGYFVTDLKHTIPVNYAK